MYTVTRISSRIVEGMVGLVLEPSDDVGKFETLDEAFTAARDYIYGRLPAVFSSTGINPEHLNFTEYPVMGTRSMTGEVEQQGIDLVWSTFRIRIEYK